MRDGPLVCVGAYGCAFMGPDCWRGDDKRTEIAAEELEWGECPVIEDLVLVEKRLLRYVPVVVAAVAHQNQAGAAQQPRHHPHHYRISDPPDVWGR